MTDRLARMTTVTIPPARGWGGEAEPREFLTLPLVVKAGVRDRELIGLVFVAVFLGIMRPWERLSAGAFGVTVTLVLGLLVCRIVVATAIALVYRLRGKPALVLDETTMRDQRSGVSIPWNSIGVAEIVVPIFNPRAGVAGVWFHLREPTTQPRINPLWGGGLKFPWRRRAGQLYVPLSYLDRPARPLAMAIAALVKLHGGQARVVGLGPSPELLTASVGREPA